MKKKLLKILLTISILTINIPTCYASSAKITNSSSTITKGNSVNVTVTINTDAPLVSIEGKLICSGAVNETYDLNFDDSSNSLKTKSYSYTLTPGSSGTISCSLLNTRVTHMMSDNWELLGADKTVITVNDPPKATTPSNGNTTNNTTTTKTKSANNYLTSLTIEGFELKELFDKEKLEYQVDVPDGTEKIRINAQVDNSNSKVSGTGEVNVTTGINNFEIVVTAENGSKRTYKLTVNVLELTPIEVKINNETYTVIRKRKDLPEISDYFTEKDITIKEEVVEGYYNEKLKYNLVGLKDSKGNIAYYIYKNNKYTLYREYTFNGTTLQVLDKELTGYKKTTFSYDDNKINSYQEVKRDIIKNTYALDNNEITGNDFYLFYAINIETGKESLYQYDAKEKTIQRYNLEVLDMYQKQSNTYYIYLLGSILIICIIIISLSIKLIHKHKKKRNGYTLDKRTMEFDED